MVVILKSPQIDSFPLNDDLNKNNHTEKWLIEMLSENDQCFRKKSSNSSIRNICVKEIGEKNGIMSYVFRVLLEFDNGNSFSLVIKKPTLEPLYGLKFTGLELNKTFYRQEIERLKEAHNIECETYELIKDVKNFPIPKIYYLEKSDHQNPGFIAMEDFYGKATTLGRVLSASQQHSLNMARHLGHFQAQMNKKSGEFGDKYLHTIYIDGFDRENFNNGLKNIAEIKPDLGKHMQFLLDFDVIKFYKYSLQDFPKEIDALTLCHGDLCTNNMMMKFSEDGSVSNKIVGVIDWQMSFEGNPYTDLVRFLTWSLDGDLRRSCEEACVNLQYDTFCEASKNLGIEVKYTREQAHKLYDYAFIQQMIELAGFLYFFKISNLESVTEEILNAQFEKIALRCKLVLDDSLKKMEKYGILEEFALKI